MRNVMTEMLLNAVTMHLIWFHGAAAAFFFWSSPKSHISNCFLCHDNHACRDPTGAVVKICKGEYCFKQDISIWEANTTRRGCAFSPGYKDCSLRNYDSVSAQTSLLCLCQGDYCNGSRTNMDLSVLKYVFLSFTTFSALYLNLLPENLDFSGHF